MSSLGRERSFALNFLDFKLRTLCDFDGGVFVEAGANDGLSQTNTLYLEKYLGWKGLLIEAVPELARKCAINRPGCIVENAALVSSSYRGSAVPMRYCNLMSVVRGAMKTQDEEDSHVAKGCSLQRVDTYALEAPARTLTSILEQNVIGHVDLLSLDVEGYELEALRGLDFRFHKPRLMLIETRYGDELERYIEPLYECISPLSHHDTLYRLR
jgi:FkbM family methyltransferase